MYIDNYKVRPAYSCHWKNICYNPNDLFLTGLRVERKMPQHFILVVSFPIPISLLLNLQNWLNLNVFCLQSIEVQLPIQKYFWKKILGKFTAGKNYRAQSVQ